LLLRAEIVTVRSLWFGGQNTPSTGVPDTSDCGTCTPCEGAST